MQPPNNNTLQIVHLSKIFSSTTTSYKYYWFLSILNHLKANGKATIPLKDLTITMFENVWYPLNHHKINFGNQDGLIKLATFITDRTAIDNSNHAPTLFHQINNKLSTADIQLFQDKLSELLRWVPYRFLRPFFEIETSRLVDSEVNKTIVELASQHFDTHPEKVIYRFVEDNIELNSIWMDYFQQHQTVLRAFIQDHLTQFLEKRNPEIVDISGKLSSC